MFVTVIQLAFDDAPQLHPAVVVTETEPEAPAAATA
jgi:hypothetical protein